MAFHATLKGAYDAILTQAAATRTYMQGWSSALAGNITGLQAVSIADHCRAVLPIFAANASAPGLAAYAVAQYGDANYDINGQYAAMITAINNVLNWLNVLPNGAVTNTGSQINSETYTPTQTAGLKTVIDALITSID